MEHKDYYNILGVNRFSSLDEIKRAYRKLARQFHPDVSKEKNADEKFKEIREAYAILKDPAKREAYDLLAPNWQTGPDGFQPPTDWERSFGFKDKNYPQGDTVGLSSFFQGMFGGNTSSRDNGARVSSMKGENIHSKIIIDLEDSINGAMRSLAIQIPEIDNHGRVVNNQRTLHVDIPKGIGQGQTILLAGQGNPGVGDGPAGDLLLEVIFKTHKLYRLRDQDIYLKLPISPWEAVLGATIQVPTPTGNVDVKIPENSQYGQRLRLNGRGLPSKDPGDFYVVLRIVLPPATDPKVKAIYEQIRDQLDFNPRNGLF
ncbi:MAG: DnaJ C-terminal domain-containing protein [Methylococcales bacterium]